MRAIRANRLKPVIRNVLPHEARFAKKGVQLGNPEMIRESAGLDSRESGHLSMEFPKEKQRLWTIFPQLSPSPTPSKTQILLILSFGVSERILAGHLHIWIAARHPYERNRNVHQEGPWR